MKFILRRPIFEFVYRKILQTSQSCCFMSSFSLLQQSVLIIAVVIFFGATLPAQTTLSSSRKPQNQSQAADKNGITAQGIKAFGRGEKDNARLLFERALKTNPKDTEAHTYLGILDDQAGNLKSAEIHFAKAARLTPKSAAAHNNYGAILLKLNRLREAATEFATSLQIDTQQPNALVNLAQIRFSENTTESLRRSFELFERAAALIPDSSIERSLTVIALRLKNLPDAARHYQIYKSYLAKENKESSDTASRAELGGALLEAGLLDEAETELKAVLAVESSNADTTVLLGRIYLARNNIKSAGRLLETAVAQNRATAAIYSLLAVVYEKSGHYENAIPAMRLAINLKPDSENYRFQYGLLLTNADAPAAAVIRLDEALKTFPDSPRLWLARGIAYLKDNKNVEAAQSITRAIELDPKFAQAYAYLGLARVQSGDYAEAVRQFEKALSTDASLTVLHQLIADAMLQQSDGDNVRIEAELKKSIALDSTFLPAYLTLGKLYVRMGRWTEAVAALNEVVRLDPESAEAYYQLGRAYVRLKRKADADAALAKFKELNESQKIKSDQDLREVVRRLADVRF
jgi:tetratricopeptide (TPR) repeat protein